MSTFRLKVLQVNQSCLFELLWGKRQELSAIVPYPIALIQAYHEWRQAYLDFYRTITEAPSEQQTSTQNLQKPFRGRAMESGIIELFEVDWQAQLVQAEANLFYHFHHWLRSAELFDIRAMIAQAPETHGVPFSRETVQHPVDIFLSCHPLALGRLPWEKWEMGSEFAVQRPIRWVRSPLNIRAQVTMPSRRLRQRTRVLAIMGDETGLDFQADRDAVQLLAPLATVEFIGWQTQVTAVDLKHQICEAIAAEPGWDILFFAGHSNETPLTGGELAIAPGVSLSLKEISSQLQVAQQRGLQLAIFNSCSGLSLASALIDLGLSQVVVMREPIHNHVAQNFLRTFLQALTEYHDAHDALLQACQHLERERITHPSTDFIPSLFRHPETPLFRIAPSNWKSKLKQWLPTGREAIVLGSILLLSLLPPLQDGLLGQRLWTQAIYRDLTHQVPMAPNPPVLLVHIDDESIRRSEINISHPVPMNRRYLARLIEQLVALNIPVIGIDYLLDRQQPENDLMLTQTVQAAVEWQQVWLTFAAIPDATGNGSGAEPLPHIANPQWTLSGNVKAVPTHLTLPPPGHTCEQTCPFAYLMALVATFHQDFPHQLQPQIQRDREINTKINSDLDHDNLRSQLLAAIQRINDPSAEIVALSQRRLSPLTQWSRKFEQLWLQPIVDYSLPQNQVYYHLPAWKLLEQTTFPTMPVALIAAGGYDGALDNFEVPQAMSYWRSRWLHLSPDKNFPWLTGGEAHAYAIHHLLASHFILLIPDIWLILCAAFLGKALTQWEALTKLNVSRRRQILMMIWVGVIGSYALVGWQTYISLGLLFPWLLPSAAFGSSLSPLLWKNNHA